MERSVSSWHSVSSLVGLEEGVEVGEGGLAVAALEEPALAARGKDLWANQHQSAFYSRNQEQLGTTSN